MRSFHKTTRKIRIDRTDRCNGVSFIMYASVMKNRHIRITIQTNWKWKQNRYELNESINALTHTGSKCSSHSSAEFGRALHKYGSLMNCCYAWYLNASVALVAANSLNANTHTRTLADTACMGRARERTHWVERQHGSRLYWWKLVEWIRAHKLWIFCFDHRDLVSRCRPF